MKILFVPARRVVVPARRRPVVPARRRPVVPARQRGGKAGVGGGGKKSPHCSVVTYAYAFAFCQILLYCVISSI
jgi:hypothetical protein